ncbi:preprotein translocase subunit SecE [bacterium]|nr:preprotein translocase subunit SecE [bacterium]
MIQGISKFVNEVKVELTKVIWPTWRELIDFTIVSLFFIVIFAFYLGGLDFVFSILVKKIF